MKNLFYILFILFAFSSCSSSEQADSADDDDRPLILDFIEVEKVPLYNSQGQTWDTDGKGPDLKVVLYRNNEAEPVFTSQVLYNVTPGNLPQHWPVVEKRIPVENVNFRLMLFDVDDDGDEEMYSGDFTPEIDQEEINLTTDSGLKIEVQFKEDPF